MLLTLEAGSILYGRYVVAQIIKQTKLYRIYLVEDQKEYNENCLLREFIAGETGTAAHISNDFAQKLSLLQKLKHPQIEEFKDFFWQDQQLFIIQSYFEGQTYQDWLHTYSSLSEVETVELLKKILPALNYLHSQQIVHGDISPSNLLLRRPDNLPVLTNFGIIRDIMMQMGVETTERKLLDKVRGLPIGLIPSGVGEDLYALAVTVVILLTGKEIEDLFNPHTQAWEWENWQLISDQLAGILNRMLALESTERFESANEILQALNASHLITPPIPPSPTISINQPPSVPDQPAWASYQSPILVSQPHNNISFEPAPTNTRSSGVRGWQKKVITGSVVGLFSLVGLVLVLPKSWLRLPQFLSSLPSTSPQLPLPISPSPSPLEQSSPLPAPTPSSTIEPSPLALSPSPSPSSISQQEAVNLVQKWLEAKRVMFAPPYNRQIAAEIATGKQYEQNAGSNGSINWLKNKGAYYRYGTQRIDNVEKFIPSGNQATIQVKVTEDRTLYNPNGTIDRKETDSKSRTVIYYLQMVDGSWKIADSQIL